MLYRFLKPFAIILFKIFFLIKVRGKENIPRRGGVIIASNHLSFLDPVVLGVASPRVLNFMARDDLFRHKLFARLISSLNAFPLKRGRPDRTALKEAIRRLREGKALVIFPEGTRSRDGRIGEGEIGAVWLSRVSGAKIIPARIYGTDKALPVDGRIIKPYPIRVVFGRAFDPDKCGDLSLEELTQMLMAKIRKL